MVKSNDENNILKGTLALSITAIIVKILGVVYKIPIAHLIGDEGMGYFNAAYTVYGFFYIVCASGLPKAITLLVADMFSEKMGKSIKSTIIKCIILFTVISTIIVLSFFAFSWVFAEWLGSTRAVLSMKMIMPSLVFICISGILRGYLNAKSRLYPIAFSQIIEALFKLIFGLSFAIIGVRLNKPIETVAAMSVFGITLCSFISSVYLLLVFKFEKQIENKGQNKLKFKNAFGKIVKNAVPITLSSSLLALSSLIDLSIIMNALTDAGYGESLSTALYGNYTTLAIPMLNLVISVITPISVSALPLLKRHFLSDDIAGFERKLIDVMKYTAFISAPCTILFTFYSYEILDLLFPSDTVAIGYMLLYYLSPSVLFLSLLTVVNTALESICRLKSVVISTLIGIVIKSVCVYMMVRNDSLGITGAPLAGNISYFVSFLVSAAILYKSIKIKGVYGSVFRYILTAFVSVYIPFTVKSLIFGSDKSSALFLLFGTISGIAYILLNLNSLKKRGVDI